MVAKTFQKNITVPKRDPETQEIIKGPDGEPLVKETLGEFTFRRPTVFDSMQIGVAKAQYLQGQGAFVDAQTQALATVFAAIPRQVEKAPEDWDWEKQYDSWVMIAIYNSYFDGLNDLMKLEAGSGEAGGATQSRVRPAVERNQGTADDPRG